MTHARMCREDRRASLVAAAMRLFARKGFSGTRSREIGQAAGVSEALVFKVFPSKKSLYAAIIEAKVREAGAHLDPADLLQLSDPVEFFTTIARSFVERIRRDDTFLRLLLFSALEGHELAAMFFRARVDPLLRAIATFIRRGIRAGRFRRVTPALAARAFTGTVFYNLQMERLFKKPLPTALGTRALVSDWVSLFLDGLRPRGGCRA